MAFRVVHLASERGWRGGEQQVAYLVEELQKNGVDNILIVKEGSALESYCVKKNWEHYAVAFSNSFDFLSAVKVRKICIQKRPDVIHLHTSKAHGVGVLAALIGNNVPMVLSRRVVFQPKRNFLTRWKYNFKGIKRILCVSDQVKEVMRGVISDSTKCTTVYPGIDLNRFKELPYDKKDIRTEIDLRHDAFVIGIVGSLSKEKDHYTFVNTLKKLRVSNIEVQGLIVGDGPLKIELIRYIHDNGLEEKIKLTGHRNDVPRILKCIDLFLFTSTEEGLGTSLLDAFASGIPVVATASGGIPEVVKHNETGLLAPAGDADGLALHVSRLIEDQSKQEELKRSAYSFVQKFTKETMGANTLNVYHSVRAKA